MQTTSAIEMFVLTGEQTGARRILDNNTTFTISGNMETDVVFRDPSINDEKINLITKDNDVYIQVLSGDIEIQGNSVKSGDILKVPEYAKIKIGETTFSYGRQVDATWRDLLDCVAKLELSSRSSRQFISKILLHKTYYLIALMLIISLILLSYYTYVNTRKVEAVQLSDQEILQQALFERGFESISVTQSDSGQISLSGFLMTNREKSEVEKLIDELNMPVLVDLSTGDHLAAEVRELYRVNGVYADVKVLKYGKVIITTKHKNRKQLERLESIALNEIPSLIELDTEYLGEHQKTEKIGPEPTFNKQDKRIVMVVNGSPPYIMTFDKSKYYIGALLPSGHKIISIFDSSVVLEKEGKTTTLQF
jgi:type III secretion protein D